MSDDLAERIVAGAIPEPNSGCWLWMGSVLPKGYGRLSVAGKMQMAHRASFQAHCGDIPSGMFVCHRCDTPACVNPDHLFLGTNADNVRDMFRKGRAALPPTIRIPNTRRRGETNGASRLSNAQRVEVTQSREPSRVLSARYGVSMDVIQRLRSGERWSPARALAGIADG